MTDMAGIVNDQGAEIVALAEFPRQDHTPPAPPSQRRR
jgi:hypothetical protein